MKRMKLSNRLNYTILAVVLIVALGVGVYAFGTNNPPVFGHSAGEIDGVCKSDGTGCPGLKTKVISIGNWNMDSNSFVDVNHGISDISTIRSISVMIRRDLGAQVYPLNRMTSLGDEVLAGSVTDVTSTEIRLVRTVNGFFDGALFDDTSFNRGWITITYE